MTIIVTGASGKFGRAAVEQLLTDIPPNNLILTTRNPERLASFAEQGVSVRYADFDDPESLRAAFAGGDTLLLISAIKVGHRIPQHRRAIDAAKKMGVKRIVYTSYVGTSAENTALVNQDHYGTERLLEDSEIAWTILRDGFYAESIIDAAVPLALKTGRWVSASGDGRIAFIDRSDCVSCAVAVLLGQGHENRTYEIVGEELWSFRDVSKLTSKITGTPIDFVDVSDDGLYEHFDALGIPREPGEFDIDGYLWCSDDMVSFERELRSGRYDVVSSDVRQILGRAPRDFRTVMQERMHALPNGEFELGNKYRGTDVS